MLCVEWAALKQVNTAFDLIESAFTTPEELRAEAVSLAEELTI